MKKFLSLMMAAAMALSLVACGSGSTESGKTSTSGETSTTEAQNLNLATGGTSGTYYAVGGALGSTMKGKLQLSEITVNSTGASKANVFLIDDGDADLAILQSDVLAYAHEGTALFESDGVVDSALWVAGLYNETVQIICSTDITDIEQLRGKSVCVGDVGSGTEFNAKQVLEAYGMTFDDINAVNGSFSDGVESLKDKKVSAAFTVAGAPTTAIVDLAMTNEFNMLSLSEDAVKYLTEKYTFLTLDPLPAGTYSGIDHEVDCVAVKAVLVASKDLSEDVVYELVKGMFDNQDALATAHAKFGLLSPEGAVAGASADLHPGAAKYYSEIGVI